MNLLTKICHIGHQLVIYSYIKYKQLRSYIYNNSLNPYKYISLHPSDFKLDVLDKEYNNICPPKYSAIMPVLNEEKSITSTLNSIENQLFPPDQVIIVDAQSTDQTVDKINEYKKHSKLDILVLTATKRNISHQRNIAIQHARNNLLVNMDAGTEITQNYISNLLGPFTEYKDLDLVGGIQHPQKSYPWSLQFTPKNHFTNKKEPYGNCVAYKKDIFLKTPGYPEYVTYAGEDTCLFYHYKKFSKHWVFNKAAYITWEHPDTFRKAQEKVMSYMIGNFEIGLWTYFSNGSRFNLPLWIGYFFEPFRRIYPTLFARQADVEINKRHIKGLRFILSKERITDNTKLQKIAQELVQDNYKVFFVDFATTIPQNTKPVFIDIDHSLLELIHHNSFNFEDYKKRYRDFIENSVFIVIDKNHEKITNIISQLHKIKVEYI
jgi:glycosyltransferase involved in cell wall biosynthesis